MNSRRIGWLTRAAPDGRGALAGRPRVSAIAILSKGSKIREVEVLV